MEKVKIKSLVNHQLLINDESRKIKRTWEKKGAVRTINFEDLEELVYDSGVEYMFRQGMLEIVDPKKDEIMVRLGLQEEGAAPIVILSDEDIKKLMSEVTSISKFRKEVNELPKEQLNKIVEYCVENKVMPYEKTTILKEKTQKDISQMVRLKEANEESSKDQ